MSTATKAQPRPATALCWEKAKGPRGERALCTPGSESRLSVNATKAGMVWDLIPANADEALYRLLLVGANQIPGCWTTRTRETAKHVRSYGDFRRLDWLSMA